MMKTRKTLAVVLALLVCAAMVPMTAEAATTYNWNQPVAGTFLWDSPASWDINGVPEDGVGNKVYFAPLQSPALGTIVDLNGDDVLMGLSRLELKRGTYTFDDLTQVDPALKARMVFNDIYQNNAGHSYTFNTRVTADTLRVRMSPYQPFNLNAPFTIRVIDKGYPGSQGRDVLNINASPEVPIELFKHNCWITNINAPTEITTLDFNIGGNSINNFNVNAALTVETMNMGPFDAGRQPITFTADAPVNITTVNMTKGTYVANVAGTIGTFNWIGGSFTAGGPNTLPTGTYAVPSGETLNITAEQTVWPTMVTIPAGAVLSGNMTGALYSGAGQNVTLNPGAVFGATAGLPPTREELGDAAILLEAVADASSAATTLTYDASVGIYKGWALGSWTSSNQINATFVANNAPISGMILRDMLNKAEAVYKGDGTSTVADIAMGATGRLDLESRLNEDAIGSVANLMTTFNFTRESREGRTDMIRFNGGSVIDATQTINADGGKLDNTNNLTGGGLLGALSLTNGEFEATTSDFTAADTGTLHFGDKAVYNLRNADSVNHDFFEALGARFTYSGAPVVNFSDRNGGPWIYEFDFNTNPTDHPTDPGTAPVFAEFLANVDYGCTSYHDVDISGDGLIIGDGKFLSNSSPVNATDYYFARQNAAQVIAGTWPIIAPAQAGPVTIGFAAQGKNVSIGLEVVAPEATIQVGTNDQNRLITFVNAGVGIVTAIPSHQVRFMKDITATGMNVQSGSVRINKGTQVLSSGPAVPFVIDFASVSGGNLQLDSFVMDDVNPVEINATQGTISFSGRTDLVDYDMSNTSLTVGPGVTRMTVNIGGNVPVFLKDLHVDTPEMNVDDNSRVYVHNKLSGSGTWLHNSGGGTPWVQVLSGGTLAPGGSVGQLNGGNVRLVVEDAVTYEWEFSDLHGEAGIGWDRFDSRQRIEFQGDLTFNIIELGTPTPIFADQEFVVVSTTNTLVVPADPWNVTINVIPGDIGGTPTLTKVGQTLVLSGLDRPATLRTWENAGPGDGLWATGANWNVAGVPDNMTIATVGSAGGAATVDSVVGQTFRVDVDAGGAIAVNGGTLPVTDSIDVAAGAGVAVSGGGSLSARTMDNSGSLSVDATGVAAIEVVSMLGGASQLTVGGQLDSISVTTAGGANIGGTVNAASVSTAGLTDISGTVNATAGFDTSGTTDITGGVNTNAFTSSGTTDIRGSLSATSIDVSDGVTTIHTGSTVSGPINVTGGQLGLQIDAGDLTVSGTGAATIQSAGLTVDNLTGVDSAVIDATNSVAVSGKMQLGSTTYERSGGANLEVAGSDLLTASELTLNGGTTTVSAGLNVLIKSDDANMNSDELSLANHLEARGINVDNVNESSGPPAGYESKYHLILEATYHTDLRFNQSGWSPTTTLPIITADYNANYANLGMATVGSRANKGNNLIVSAGAGAHPLGAAFIAATGNAEGDTFRFWDDVWQGYITDTNLGAGTGTVLAEINGTDNALVVYDVGDTLANGTDTATGIRMTLPSSDRPNMISGEGLTLFDLMVDYAIGTVRPDTSMVSLVVAADSTLVTDSLAFNGVTINDSQTFTVTSDAGVTFTSATLGAGATLTLDTPATAIAMTNMTLGGGSMVKSTTAEAGGGDVTITLGGTLSGGDGVSSVGEFWGTGSWTSLTLAADSTYEQTFTFDGLSSELNGGGLDMVEGNRIDVWGSLTLGDNVRIKLVDNGGSADGEDVVLFRVAAGIDISTYSIELPDDWGSGGLLVDAPNGLLILQNLNTGATGPLPGDANNNGAVGDADWVIFKAQFGGAPGGVDDDADFNNDGRVDLRDLAILKAAWDGGPGAPELPGSTATPEPATMSLLAIGGLLVLRRRRRKA